MLLVVDVATGSDNNSGTAAAPLATLIEAERRLPFLIDHDVEIRVVGSGTYTMPSFRQRVYRLGQIYVHATPVTTLLGSTLAGSGSGVSVVKSTGLATDQYRDEFIHILSGAAAGQRRMIKTNTATDIVPVRNFTVAVAAGDAYEILRPSVTLLGGTGVASPLVHGTLIPVVSIATNFEPTLNFENFLIDRTTFVTGRVGFWQCRTTAIGILTARAGSPLCGTDGLLRGAVAPFLVYGGAEKDWFGAGLAHQFNEEPDVGGTFGFVSSAHGCFIRFGTYTQIFGGNIRDDHTTIDGANTSCALGGDAGAQLQISDGQATGALRVRNGAACQLLNCRVDGSGTICVAVESGGVLNITGLTSTNVQLVGGTYGIHARRALRALYARSFTRDHGATTPIAVGEIPTTSAAFANVGDAITSVDLSVITRVE
jgi:hypothetical protein